MTNQMVVEVEVCVSTVQRQRLIAVVFQGLADSQELIPSLGGVGNATGIENVLVVEDTANLGLVILAGGFGSYLKKESAAAIGLIPKELLPITDSVGNAAGEGAVSAAISKKAREQLSIIQKSMHYIELSTHPDFSQEYMNQMDFDGSER